MINNFRRFAFPLLSAACLVFGCHSQCFADKPNVVIMFADDMGYADGNGDTEIPIPSLERLADDGVRFTNAYVSAPICVASRMGLMSGCHQQRFGIYGNVHGKTTNARALQQTLLPKVFQDGGYRTGLVGKWHLGGNGKAGFQYGGPLNRGFDEFVGISGGHSDFWEGTSILRGTKIIKAPKYLTDCWGDEACEFLERNTDNPFFLYLAFNAVHSPMHSLEADKVKLPGDKSKGEMRETYGGMMTAMDRNVGRVLDKLDALGLADNTIVMFLNDNGGGGHTDAYAEHSRNFADNSPYRGFKYDLYEGGIRTPFYMRWPGHIKKGSAYKANVSSMDVFPTVVAAAGLKLPSQPCDGKDLIPFLNDPSQVGPHPSLCWQNRCWSQPQETKPFKPSARVHNSAVRKDNWKLVRYSEKIDSKDAAPPWQLYDLSKDVAETTDVSRQHPQIVKELSQIFSTWRASMQPSSESRKQRRKPNGKNRLPKEQAAAMDEADVVADDGKWVNLFNGQNLDDWTSRGGAAPYEVDGDEIVGTTAEGSPNSFLCKGPFANFIFECEVKCDTPLNSGIQIRSQVWIEDIKEYMKRGQSNIGFVYGYQCEISPNLPHRCGHVWDEHRRRQWLDEFVDKKATPNPYKVGQWNHYRIKAQGNHIQTWINGEAVADFEDEMDSTGFIGLQVHSIKKGTGPFSVRWRKVRIRELK